MTDTPSPLSPAAAALAALAPLVVIVALLLLAGFGVGLAAHATTAYGAVAGFAFAIFAAITAMRFFGNRV